MVKAKKDHEAVDNYRSKIGWGSREQTVSVDIDGNTVSRRLDIADLVDQRGVEYKTGYQSANKANVWELKRDSELVKKGWDIEWTFEQKPSKPLLEALESNGIRVSVLE